MMQVVGASGGAMETDLPQAEKKGLVSVLMVVRNEEARIAAAIESVLVQTYLDLELIVIDGLSSDRTFAIASEYAAVDQRVRVVLNPRKTIPAGLNVGLESATGEFIGRLDGHSTWTSGNTEIGVYTLRADPNLVGVGGRRIGVGSSPVGRAIAVALGSKFGVGNSLYHYGTELAEVDHITAGIYRNSVIRDVGGWDSNLAANEDVDIDFRIRQSGGRLRFDPAMTTFWSVRETLAALAHQYRRYGRGKALMVRKNGPRSIRIRHLVPPTLVASMLASAITSLWVPVVPFAFLGVYVSGLLIAGISARNSSGDSRVHLSTLSAAFAAMHIAWGCGFLEGFLLGASPADSSSLHKLRKGESR